MPHWIPLVLITAGILLTAALWKRAWEVVHQIHQRIWRRPPPRT